METEDRKKLKNKISEIARGFDELSDKIEDMPEHDFASVSREIDDFRFKYGKVLNLSPEGEKESQLKHMRFTV
jgi:hypothetical protein